MTVSTLTKLTRRLLAAHTSANWKTKPMKIYLPHNPAFPTRTLKVTPMALDERLTWAADRSGSPETFAVEFIDSVADVPAALGTFLVKHGIAFDRQLEPSNLFDRLRASRTSLS